MSSYSYFDNVVRRMVHWYIPGPPGIVGSHAEYISKCSSQDNMPTSYNGDNLRISDSKAHLKVCHVYQASARRYGLHNSSDNDY